MELKHVILNIESLDQQLAQLKAEILYLIKNNEKNRNDNNNFDRKYERIFAERKKSLRSKINIQIKNFFIILIMEQSMT